MRELKNAIRLDVQRILDSLFLVAIGILIWVFFGILKGLMDLVFFIAMIAVMTTTSAFYGSSASTDWKMPICCTTPCPCGAGR